MNDPAYSHENYTADYTLVYHPRIEKTWVTPVLTLDNLLEFVNNNVLTKPRDQHNDGEINAIARLIRLNWMVQDLRSNPMVKPIVAYCKFSNYRDPEETDIWEVVIGDTRLQALELLPEIKHVAVILQIPVFQRDYYNFKEWRTVNTAADVATALGQPGRDVVICNQDWHKEQLDWLEFDLPNSETHMHDEDARLRMGYNYLDQAGSNFKFTREWLQTPVDWSKFDNL